MMKHDGLRALLGVSLLCGCGNVDATQSDESESAPASPLRRASASEQVPRSGRDLKQIPGVDPQGSAAVGSDTWMLPPTLGDELTGAEPSTPYCAGSPTSLIEVGGNLDASTSMIDDTLRPFDSSDPANTANFSTTITAYDALGRAWTLDIYFRRHADFWSYHVLAPGIEVGNGVLGFDDEGSLVSHYATWPVQLPVPLGSSPNVQLSFGQPRSDGGSGRAGMTSVPDASNIRWQHDDGEAARWGFNCLAPPPPRVPPEQLPPTWVLCGSQRTTRIAVSANLSSSGAPATAPWDPSHPAATASLRTALTANDAAGTPLAYELYFRKEDAARWSYHLFLLSEAPGPELSAGELLFNANGSLKQRTETSALHLPNVAGQGERVELDWGLATDDGGSGVDGVTSFAGGSRLLAVTADGWSRDCVPNDGGTAGLLPGVAELYARSIASAPACAGSETRQVRVNANLDARALADERADLTSQTIYDAALRPWLLRLQFRHAAPSLWEAFATASGPDGQLQDAGRVVWVSSNGLTHDNDGAPILDLHLPLADGNTGPTTRVDFSAVTTFAGSQNVWLDSDGAEACERP